MSTGKVKKIVDNRICFSLCFFMLSGGSLQGSTYYVATTGNDSNAGTSVNSPWRTVQKAASTASAGDTVYIKAGNYGSEKVVFAHSGTQAGSIVFEGYKTTPGDNPVVNYAVGDTLSSANMPLFDGGDRASAGTNFYGYGKDYIVLKNIQIQNYNTGVRLKVSNRCVLENIIAINMGDQTAQYDGYGIRIIGTAADRAVSNIVKRCVVANCCAEGLLVNYGDLNRIEDCQAYCTDTNSVESGMDYYIEILIGNSNTVRNCYVERDPNVKHQGHGIELKGDCVHNAIMDCISVNQNISSFSVRHDGVVYNVFENCTALGGGTGLCVRDGAHHNTFKNCRTVGCGQAVTFTETSEDGSNSAGDNNVFENCIFENTNVGPESCISFNEYSTNGAAFDNLFRNCTFYDAAFLFECDRANYGNTLVNCIVMNVDNLKSGAYSLNYSAAYSDFYLNGFSVPSGTGNFSGDPAFVDISNSDFCLKPASPGIDAGGTLSLYNDYNYQARPYNGSYDIGAYEYCDKDARIHIQCNENSGTTTADAMNNVPSGSLIGGVGWYASGRSGSALNFYSSSGTVSFDSPDLLDLTGSRTISAWIWPDTVSGTNAIVAKYLWGYSLFICEGKLKAHVAGSTRNASSTSVDDLGVHRWQHVAMTFDFDGDKKIHLYIDGEEVSYSSQVSMSGSPTDTSAWAFTIGSDRGWRYLIDAVIDEVKVFNRPLSAREIFEESAAVINVKFDGGADDIVYDVNYGNSGTNELGCRVEGKIGRGMYFDGECASINFGKPAILDVDGSRSISAWVKPRRHDQYNTIASKYLWGYSLFTSYGKLRGCVKGSSVNAKSTSTATLALDTWQYVTMTFDADGDKKVHLYINGTEVSYSEQVAMSGDPVSTSNYDFCIGSDRGISSWFSGAVDDVCVFDKALTSSKVAEIYNQY